MGKVAKGIGKALGHIAGSGLTTITGGVVDGGALLTQGKIRIAAPLSGKAVRNLAGGVSNALSLGLAEKQIDSLLNTKQAKLTGTAVGAAAGLATGAGLASSLASGAAGAASAAGSAGGGLAPGALTSGLATASGTGSAAGSTGSVLSALGTVAPIAAAAPSLLNAGKKAPGAPAVDAAPTPDEIAKRLEEDRASAEATARRDRSRKVAGSFRKKGPGEEDLTAALVENRTASRSVLGGF